MAPNKYIISIGSISFLFAIVLFLHTIPPHSNPSHSALSPIYYASSHRLLEHDAPQMLSEIVEGTWDDVHIVFTTGCNGYQNWQSETLLYSWARIQHPGRITRIIAGCKNDKERVLANTTAVPNDDNRILFYFVADYTPSANDSKGVKPGQRPFHYFNKPHGMHVWIKDQFDDIYENVIVLLDPDMIILRPFLFHIESEAHKWAQWQNDETADSFDGKVRDMWVREGHPVSQKYGIGAKWAPWKGFCDDRESCHPSSRDAWKYYSIGPPYIMHKNDWAKITPLWVQYSPLALEYEPQPSILAEMYSYVIACAYYGLQHQYLFSMVSDPGSSPSMENVDNLNWAFVGGNSDVKDRYHEFHIIHYCQGFWLGETRNEGTIRNGGWNWHKGHVPQEILYECEIPLLVLLDDEDEELIAMYKRRDKSKDDRHYWVLYHIYKYVDQALANYRLKFCEEPNLEYKLVLQQPEADKKTHRR
eukprot:278632_1